jgi:NADPH:quinone reductase-like Zn-dependent oxidoreductase
MKAVYLETKGGPEALVMGELPPPVPKDGEVLVKVCATAVTPTEFGWFPTFNLPSGEPRPFPIVLSHEFSGVVKSVGPNVQWLVPGEEVYGINDWFANGAQAEYCVCARTALGRKPQSVTHTQAAATPISALTAWQGLFDRGGLQSGQRVLVHGASGGVGAFAVQFARRHGAQVIATASSGNLDFVRYLGAEEVIDYRAIRFEEAVRDIDLVFDGVGGDTLQRSWSVLKRGGQIVSLASQYGAPLDQRSRDAFMLVQPDGARLTEIAKLIDGGEIRLFVEQVFPLDKAREAYERAARGGMRGKVALSVSG